MKHRKFAVHACVAAAMMFGAGNMAAQSAAEFPVKPVTVIVPFDGGSSQEGLLRSYVQSIQEASGRQFLLSPRPGAGTTVGTAVAAKAPADGYTILSVSPAMAITPSVYPDLPYDAARDFAPISLLTKQAYLLVVHPAAPYKTMREYIEYARTHPGELNWSSSGAGSATHLPGELLHYLTKTQVTFVHYKAGSQRLVDLMAGRVHVTMASFFNVMASIKAGKLRALAVTTDKRVPIWADLATIDEQGVTGYDFSSWAGLVAPARTPPAIIGRLNALFTTAGNDPTVIKLLEADGRIMVNSSPEQFRQHLATETERWRRLIKETGLKVDP